MIIDALMTMLYDQPYDADGKIAAHGQVLTDWLNALKQHVYFTAPPPKSTGRELFGWDYARELKDTCPSDNPADLIATATQLTVDTIIDAYQRFVLPITPITEVIIGGGGVKNQVMVAALARQFAPLGASVKTHEDYGISSQYKEAIAFALLGAAYLARAFLVIFHLARGPKRLKCWARFGRPNNSSRMMRMAVKTLC